VAGEMDGIAQTKARAADPKTWTFSGDLWLSENAELPDHAGLEPWA